MARVSEGSKAERFGFIAERKSSFGVRYLCQRLNVSSSGYYKWLNQRDSKRTIDNRKLAHRIEKIFDDHDGNYGSPRIHRALRDDGLVVNHKRVERIMRETGLVGKAAKLYRRKALQGNPCIKVENIKRELDPPCRPNEQWAGDVTYLKVNGKWSYLAVILDLYSRRIIGWSLSNTRTVNLTHMALKQALDHRLVRPGLVFHSDRGSEYGAHLYQDELKRAGIRASMNRPKHMTDNAHVESFFRTLKTECFHGVTFLSESELRITLAWNIDCYYNVRRSHTSIGFKAPAEYESMVA